MSESEWMLIFTALNAQADRFAAMAEERSGASAEAMRRNEELMRDLAHKVGRMIERVTA